MLSQFITRSYVEYYYRLRLFTRIRTFGSDKGDYPDQLFEYKQLSTMEQNCFKLEDAYGEFENHGDIEG